MTDVPSDPISRVCSVEESSVLGISVHYLSTVFLKEVEEEFGHSDCNYYEVNERMLASKKAKGAEVICPRDGAQGCSYVDAVHALESGNTDAASVMLSWSWQYSVRTVVRALVRWCTMEKRDPKKVFVWQCALCNNQFRVEASKASGEWESFETFKALFEKRMDHTSHVLSLMAPWGEPINITRIWCVFEKYVALAKGHKFDVIMPEEEDAKFQEALETTGMQPIWDLFFKVDIQKAQATAETDRRNILHLVDPDLPEDNLELYSNSCARINASVVYRLQQWFVKQALESIQQREEAGDPIPMKAYVNVAWLLSQQRNDEKTWGLVQPMYEKGVQAGRATNQENTKEFADLLCKLASFKQKNKILTEAAELMTEAEMRFEKADARNTEEYADFLKCRALHLRFLGHYDEMTKQLHKAQEVLEKAGLQETRTYAGVLRYLGQCYRHTAPGKVMEYYENSKYYFEETKSTFSQGYASLLSDMALHIYRRHREGGTELFEQARRMFVALGLTQSAEYASILDKFGKHYRYHHMLPEAYEKMKEASDLQVELRMGKTRNHAHVLADLANVEAALKKPEWEVTIALCLDLVDRLLEEEEKDTAEHDTLRRLKEKAESMLANKGDHGKGMRRSRNGPGNQGDNDQTSGKSTPRGKGKGRTWSWGTSRTGSGLDGDEEGGKGKGRTWSWGTSRTGSGLDGDEEGGQGKGIGRQDTATSSASNHTDDGEDQAIRSGFSKQAIRSDSGLEHIDEDAGDGWEVVKRKSSKVERTGESNGEGKGKGKGGKDRWTPATPRGGEGKGGKDRWTPATPRGGEGKG
eukprot:CAMPEP_0204309890 /NCGR_PEP_ID=MMETSP0469-20131031/1375_1 /ASSEMBLY_ACC=CAM_ASM_000384 /TAXON_ID=2969 /ORGANISM="Oxyrrhis marina" /LENGTH=810 /DNA_ID=CAMNT_0051289577 /DNA_START=23 /DNA_END=2452 /DNA_ORIENTATION=-